MKKITENSESAAAAISPEDFTFRCLTYMKAAMITSR